MTDSPGVYLHSAPEAAARPAQGGHGAFARALAKYRPQLTCTSSSVTGMAIASSNCLLGEVKPRASGGAKRSAVLFREGGAQAGLQRAATANAAAPPAAVGALCVSRGTIRVAKAKAEARIAGAGEELAGV